MFSGTLNPTHFTSLPLDSLLPVLQKRTFGYKCCGFLLAGYASLSRSQHCQNSEANSALTPTRKIHPLTSSFLNPPTDCRGKACHAVSSRDAPIIVRLSAVLPIISIPGRLLQQYRLIIIYTHISDNTSPNKRPFIERPHVLSDHF